MDKWLRRLYTIAMILLTIFTLWGLWNNYEKTKLNQRYARMIEQRGLINEEYHRAVEHLVELNDKLSGLRSQVESRLGLKVE